MAKNNMMKKIFILAVLLLGMALCLPCGASAESNQAHKLTPKEKQLMAQAPRTPEELLKRIHSWTNDPYQDAYNFVEKLTGLERKHWKCKHGGALKGNITCGVFSDDKKIVPFRLGTQITTTNHIWTLHLNSMDTDFCVTPLMVRQIFGEPDRQEVLMKWYIENWGEDMKYPRLEYTYRPRKKGQKNYFVLSFRFKLSKDDLKNPNYSQA